jgi:hypothetical protein
VRRLTPTSPLDPPSHADIVRLRVWLRTAVLPDPPMITMPGVEARSPELTRRQLIIRKLAEARGTTPAELHAPPPG